MNISIKAKNLELTPAIKSYAEEKFESLIKYEDDLQLVKVELEMLTQKHTDKIFRAEVMIDAPHHVYRAESREADLYAAIDTVIPKVVVQIEKVKNKRVAKTRKAVRQVKRGQT